jgi:RNA polymerase sigma factor (sigma-70 family)
MPNTAVTFDLESIYRDHYARFVRLGYSLVGKRDVAEELVQDSFIQANEKWRLISQYEDPVGWIRRVLVNRCTDVLRRDGTERRAILRIASTSHLAVMPTENQQTLPDDLLWDAVRSLPGLQAAVIALSYLEDLDIDEVASALSISPSTARTHLQRAKAQLAGLLLGQHSTPAAALTHSKDLS